MKLEKVVIFDKNSLLFAETSPFLPKEAHFCRNTGVSAFWKSVWNRKVFLPDKQEYYSAEFFNRNIIRTNTKLEVDKCGLKTIVPFYNKRW